MSKPYPPISYGEYLQIDRLLACQEPRSAAFGRPVHDETLFIIIHQVYELWFKQILHELDSVVQLMAQDDFAARSLGIAVARMQRVTEIQKVLMQQLQVLETMTALDFLDFRDYLFPASGFQSVQFRLIENLLGLPPERRLAYNQQPYYAQAPAAQQELLRQSETRPSLFSTCEKWLERTPFLELAGFHFWDHYRAAVERMLRREREFVERNTTATSEERHRQLQEVSNNEESFAALFDEDKHRQLRESGRRRFSYRALQAALLIHLYRDHPILHLPFRLLTVLVDVDALFTSWRHRHALMVHRMIGNKIGTGGSSGYHYLRATVDKYKVFADLCELPTFLIPRMALPELPQEFQRHLGFYYSELRREG